jgi:histone deacetylase 1/2
MAFISSQLSRKQAATKYGDLALRAQMKELMQMRDLQVMYPVNFHTLSREQRKKVIRSHMIFQPKYDPNTGEFIKLKARFVADGSTQDKSLYDDVSSPTVSTHAVFINAAVAAKEKRIVKVVDLPGAYLHADMSGEEVLMHICKEDAEILILMDPKFKQYLRTDGSMVVKLSKALYGCIESAKLWYAEISKTFRSIGYKCNPKDICVFNKTVAGVQCTITLHVDDLMVTSITETMIDEVMNELRKHYERDGAELDVKEGKLHNYLGMTFDFSVEGQVKITMNKYVSEVLKFTEVKGTVSTPATIELYTITESEKLGSVDSEYFHTVVAKLLYLSKRVRPDLLTAVGYLAKRVNVSTKMDMVKLERVLRYLNCTSDLGLTLRPCDHLSVFSHIDASYAVHHDMKSQTGVTITLGDGVTYAKSTTQQLNSKSSTEAELIALTEASGHVIWVRDYLIGQGYPIGPATIYQDNMSTMALVKKGYSTSTNTRHINIRYFFIKDRVDSEELKIEYLPTEDMIADFFTKPLQGDLFKRLRDKILGIHTIDRAFIACF